MYKNAVELKMLLHESKNRYDMKKTSWPYCCNSQLTHNRSKFSCKSHQKKNGGNRKKRGTIQIQIY